MADFWNDILETMSENMGITFLAFLFMIFFLFGFIDFEYRIQVLENTIIEQNIVQESEVERDG